MVAFPKPQADRLSEMDEAPQGPPQSAQGSQPTPRWLPMTPNTVMLKSPHIFSGDHHLLTTGTPLSQDRLLIKENIHPDYFCSWHFYSFHFAGQENTSEKAEGT